MALIQPRPITTRQPGPFAGLLRVCERPGCDTRLNSYNPSSYCLTHARSAEASPRQAREALQDLMTEIG